MTAKITITITNEQGRTVLEVPAAVEVVWSDDPGEPFRLDPGGPYLMRDKHLCTLSFVPVPTDQRGQVYTQIFTPIEGVTP